VFSVFFGEESDLWAMISYAAVVTIIAVFVTLWVGKIPSKITGQPEESKP
jgi:hypothetical protein